VSDLDDEFTPLSNEERLAHARKTAVFSIHRGKPGDLEWALQYVISSHTYDTTRRTESKPDDPGWHACRCGTWEGYWSGYNHHVAEDQVKMLVAAGLVPKEAP
jgi:hypothetical protein